VVDRSLVLTIDPDYFRLTGGVERWLYRVARKHAGRQPDGWVFELAQLHHKSGSLARASDFALDVRRVVARQTLPGYRLMLDRLAGRERLRILPLVLDLDLPVDKVGISGAATIGISGATVSGYQAHEEAEKPCEPRLCAALNLDSNSESNFLSEESASNEECARAGGR
jgi:plasmid replication initiation protein